MILRRLAGLVLLGLVLLPLPRLLDPARSGPAGATTRRAAEAAWRTGLIGLASVVVAAVLLARLLPLARLPSLLGRLADGVGRLPRGGWALGMGAVAFLGSSAAALLLYRGRPSSVDEMVQLLHAGALARGRLGWALPGPPAAWVVPNGVLVDGVWSSIYPPGQTALLALGIRVGATWWVGPLATGLAAGLSAAGLQRLLPREPRVAAWAGLAVASSPFLLFLGGTHLSHTAAAGFTALVFWSALRSRDGSWGWAVLTGGAVGALVCTRPWIGLVLGTLLPLSIWWPWPELGPGPLVRRVGAMVVGGVPFAVTLLAWNSLLYGHPLRLGYTAAFGPSHGLGFHIDPWGNRYGLTEALAYTSADLSLLDLHLLETPLGAVAVIGLGLLAAPRLIAEVGPLLVWAGGAVLAAALYWHHGVHLGPRLLYESAPAWAALAVIAPVALHRRISARHAGAAGALRWMGVLAVGGAVLLGPGQVRAVGDSLAAAVTVPSPPTPGGSSLVLVHGSWSGRVGARLVAMGLRRDPIETALRQNDLCRVQRYADARHAGRPGPTLDWDPRPGSPAGLRMVEISPGNHALLDPAVPLTPGCRNEARADARAGTVELTPLLWQAPPDDRRRMLLGRDLGPEENRAILAAHAGRTPYLLVPDASGEYRLMPYGEGLARIWGVVLPGSGY